MGEKKVFLRVQINSSKRILIQYMAFKTPNWMPKYTGATQWTNNGVTVEYFKILEKTEWHLLDIRQIITINFFEYR